MANGSAAGRRKAVQPRPSKAAEQAASQQWLEIEHSIILCCQLGGVMTHPLHPAKKRRRAFSAQYQDRYRGAKRKGRIARSVLRFWAGTVYGANIEGTSCKPAAVTDRSSRKQPADCHGAWGKGPQRAMGSRTHGPLFSSAKGLASEMTPPRGKPLKDSSDKWVSITWSQCSHPRCPCFSLRASVTKSKNKGGG